MSAPKGTKAYSVSLPDFVVFATSESGAIDAALTVVHDGALSLKRLTPDRLRREFGGTFPCQDYDPDQAMTCSEIADAMLDEEDEARAVAKLDAAIDANLERNHNILCGCSTPNEGACAMVSR